VPFEEGSVNFLEGTEHSRFDCLNKIKKELIKLYFLIAVIAPNTLDLSVYLPLSRNLSCLISKSKHIEYHLLFLRDPSE